MLLSEVELGQSDPGLSGTVIGISEAGRPTPESDIRLAESDIQLGDSKTPIPQDSDPRQDSHSRQDPDPRQEEDRRLEGPLRGVGLDPGGRPDVGGQHPGAGRQAAGRPRRQLRRGRRRKRAGGRRTGPRRQRQGERRHHWRRQRHLPGRSVRQRTVAGNAAEPGRGGRGVARTRRGRHAHHQRDGRRGGRHPTENRRRLPLDPAGRDHRHGGVGERIAGDRLGHRGGRGGHDGRRRRRRSMAAMLDEDLSAQPGLEMGIAAPGGAPVLGGPPGALAEGAR